MPRGAEAHALAAPAVCYHCGEPVPGGAGYSVQINGTEQPMCCPGCRAVASLIAASGLDTFYGRRTAYNERPGEESPARFAHNSVYDEPQMARTFTCGDEQGMITASLLLGGITCAACAWLIEQSTAAIPGVTHTLVNLQQTRLDIRFDPGQCKLSEIFTHIEKLGYRPRPYQYSTARSQAMEERRADLKRLAVAGLGMMQVGMFAVALHAGDIQGIEARYEALLRWVSFPVAGFVVVYSARPFFTQAWRNLRHGALVMDLPVALAIGLAFAASTLATVTGTGQVYFDSVVMFTFLLLLGRFLEQRVRQRHLFDVPDAESALPDAVTVRRNDQWHTVSRTSLGPGDLLLVKAGETVPIDARVIEGASTVREDAFNGEHLPRPVSPGTTIYAGTLNLEDALQAEVLVNYRDSRLAAVQRSIDLAQSAKPRLVVMADRIAGWFVAGVLLAAAATALAWIQVDPGRAFWITLSVLMVSCPCALALATPTALTSAANALRGRGVMVAGENALESLSRSTHLVLDKTGTLTRGEPSVSRVRPLGSMAVTDILATTAALQRYTNHPFSSAFAAIDGAGGFHSVAYLVGRGLEGSRDGVTYRVGSLAFCRELLPRFPAPPAEDLYWIALCREEEPLAWIGLDDTLRPDARALVDDAREMGLQVELLTGDSSPRGPQLATALGIDTVATGQTPEQKMQRVERLQRSGATVVMVGDGLNDAPVLAVADASFAVSSATDLARSQADFTVVAGGLERIVDAIRTARRCRVITRQNFAWALAYNLGAMPLAALGYVPPWAAAIGMSASSLLVLLNSLRLARSPGER